MNDKSTTEAILGSPITQTLAAAGAAYAGANAQLLQSVPTMLPIAVSVLPLLLNSLPQQRQQQRHEEELAFLRDLAEKNAAALEMLTDPQFKFFNDLVPVLLQNYEEEKRRYLRAALQHALHDPSIDFGVGAIVARILRDISAQELKFMQEAFAYEEVGVKHSTWSPDDKHEVNFYWLDDTLPNRTLIAGLLSLGLVMRGQRMMESYILTPFVPKLLSIVGH